MSIDDDIMDDLFLGCALAAFLEEAISRKGPPNMEATRLRAYRLYEESLAERHSSPVSVPMLTADGSRLTSPKQQSRGPMSKTLHTDPPIQIGDNVFYRLSDEEPMSRTKGKVIGLFKTRDGQIMADVEWEKLGPPKRVNTEKLSKAQGTVAVE
ncbi:MAG TPA: hypothetical protein VHC22_19245 [Pirellulales bacterium]|nr:hypothetical protein [Pirellulales bacterium]